MPFILTTHVIVSLEMWIKQMQQIQKFPVHRCLFLKGSVGAKHILDLPKYNEPAQTLQIGIGKAAFCLRAAHSASCTALLHIAIILFFTVLISLFSFNLAYFKYFFFQRLSFMHLLC